MSRQFFVPGGQYTNENTNQQFRIPGGPYVDQTAANTYSDTITSTVTTGSSFNTGSSFSDTITSTVTGDFNFTTVFAYRAEFIPALGMFTESPTKQFFIPGLGVVNDTGRNITRPAVYLSAVPAPITSTVTANNTLAAQMNLSNQAVFNIVGPDMPNVVSTGSVSANTTFGALYPGDSLFGGESTTSAGNTLIDNVVYQIVLISDWFGVI